MQRITINDNNNTDGIEAIYYPEYKALYIHATNSGDIYKWPPTGDWKENITGWLWPKWVKGIGFVNRHWYKEILWLCEELFRLDFEVDYIFGHSKGGSQACYLSRLLNVKKVVGFGSFPAWFIGKLPGILYMKPGDYVPLLSMLRYDIVVTVGGEPLPIEAAHYWSMDEIESVIRLECAINSVDRKIVR